MSLGIPATTHHDWPDNGDPKNNTQSRTQSILVNSSYVGGQVHEVYENLAKSEKTLLKIIFSDELSEQAHTWRIWIPGKTLRENWLWSQHIKSLMHAYRADGDFITVIRTEWMLEEAIELNTILTDEDLERLTVIINIHASPYRRDMEFPGLLRLACKATLDKLTQEMERGRYRAEDIAQYQSMQTEILQFLKTRESWKIA